MGGVSCDTVVSFVNCVLQIDLNVRDVTNQNEEVDYNNVPLRDTTMTITLFRYSGMTFLSSIVRCIFAQFTLKTETLIM